MQDLDYKASQDSVDVDRNPAGATLSSSERSPSANHDYDWHSLSNMAVSNVPVAGLPTASIVVPLYQYPLNSTTWAPLYDAIDHHSHVQFVVIVNPNSGPGEPPGPDPSYSNEIPRLNAKNNVQTIGYVSTDYCRRAITDVVRDIEVYSEWPVATSNAGIHVDGIFFDETPNVWTFEVADYLDRVTLNVKQNEGIQGGRLVMHNPGTVPDERLAQVKPADITAVFEESWSTFNDESVQERLAGRDYDRSTVSYIVHSTPIEEIKGLVEVLRPRAQYLFVTDLKDRVYESFGPGWIEFVEAVAQGSGAAITCTTEAVSHSDSSTTRPVVTSGGYEG